MAATRYSTYISRPGFEFTWKVRVTGPNPGNILKEIGLYQDKKKNIMIHKYRYLEPAEHRLAAQPKKYLCNIASPPKAWFLTRSEGGQHFGFAPFLTYIPPMSKEVYNVLM